MTNQNVPQWKQAINNSYTKYNLLCDNQQKVKQELGFAMQIFEGNSYLQKCDTTSIMNAILNIGRVNSTLNPVMRLAYLIPRKNKCMLEFSYMGLVALLKSNGCIKSISAHIVFGDDEFDYDVGANKIHHKPKFAQTEAEHKKRIMVGCYSRAVLPDESILYEFMPKWEIDKVKNMSEGSGSKFSAWNTWADEMVKKSVIKRHFKMLISESPNLALQTTLQIENENNKLTSQFQPKANIMSGFDDIKPQATLFEEPTTKEIQQLSDDVEHNLNMTDNQIEEELDRVVENQRAGGIGYIGSVELPNDIKKVKIVKVKEKVVAPKPQAFTTSNEDLFSVEPPSTAGLSKSQVDELYSEKDDDFGKKKE